MIRLLKITLAISIIGIPYICLAYASDEEFSIENLQDHNQSNPSTRNPEIDFTSQPPVVDGELDDMLNRLPIRKFSYVGKRPEDNPLIPASYRLAYGIEFLYIYIEAKAETLTYRDRAYQFGDGFHMIIAAPRANGEPSDEFALLAFSAIDKPAMEWSRRLRLSFSDGRVIPSRPSENTQFAFTESGGKISFELMLSWRDAHPFHPWISEGIGLNLCFVKAVGDQGFNMHLITRDPRMLSEKTGKHYCRLTFQEPEFEGKPQTFVSFDRNHITAGETLDAKAVTIAAEPVKEHLFVRLKTGERHTAGLGNIEYDCDKGVNLYNFNLKAASRVPAGGYHIEWSSRLSRSRGEADLTVLPEFKPEKLNAGMERIRNKITPGSYTTFQFLIKEISGQLSKIRPYETCAEQRMQLSNLFADLRKAEEGEDIYAKNTGLLRRAFRSKVDETLQPYCVTIPNDFNRTKKYPLLVVLHGSASDETNITGFSRLNPGCFIVLAPRGRGTSNAFSRDHAQEDIAEAIEDVCANYPIDTSRIFLAGFSMGGYGVYRTFYRTPDKFKALIVLSGHPDLANSYFPGENHPNFLEENYLKPFAGVPIFIFHGKGDRSCPFEMTEGLVEKLKQVNANVTFVFEDNKGHEAPGESTLSKYHEWLGKLVEN